jgi:hypothetical protein
MLARPSITLVLGAFVLIVAGCSGERQPPTEVRAPIFQRSASSAGGLGEDAHFGTHLAGRNEVPARPTRAQGEAIFRLSDDGKSVAYKLIASNIDNPFMAHIHMAPAGVNGGIVVWLYPSTAPVPGPAGSGRHDGELAHGTFTASDLVGALKGHPLSDLLAAIAARNAYVNVHTSNPVNPGDLRPGNFPGGEIRGQLGPKQDDADDDDEDDVRVVKMLDDCDPASFNAALGAGTCVGPGKTTFQSFIAELQATHVAAKWMNVPSQLEAERRETLIAMNLGGETHTFTRVAQFGGGIVPTLNTLSNNPVEAPECKTLEADDFVAPGGQYKETVTKDDIQRFQCCIHPWMRTTVHREHGEGHEGK